MPPTAVQTPRVAPAGASAGPPERERSESPRPPPRRIRPRSATGAGELVLERYRLQARLGAGGFGEVWSAHDELLNRAVAVKRIRLGAREEADRATREAQASARLSHPAIVALYEACAVEDCFYLISELVDGHTLAKRLADDDLDDSEILAIGRSLAAALSHAHGRGVIHRDIKPHNVLIPHAGGEGAAKLTDFGGASLAGEDGLTRTGDVLGTLAYMAPEQSEGREVGEEADLYSLALVLYEALAGFNPVRGANPAATARRIGARLPPLERERPDLPRGLTRAIDLALQADPRRRGALEDLSRALAAADGGHGPISPRELQRTRTQAPLRSRPEPRAALLARAPESPPVVEDPPAPASAPRARLALPRAIWIGCALALIAWQALAGRPGIALLLACALAPLVLLPRRSGPAWLLAALAPALGVLGLAGAYPACAGQLRGAPRRAAVGALGYWWLTLAAALLHRRLWLSTAGASVPRDRWEASLSGAASHVISPSLSLGVLLGAALWGFGAAALPVLVRGRSAALDLVAATVWSAGLAAFAPEIDAGLTRAGAHPEPRGLVLGAVLGGVVAVAARAVRGPVRPPGA